MSTIHEALKKVQDNMGTPENPAEQAQDRPVERHNPFNPPPPQPETTEAEEEPEDNKKKIGIVILLGVIITALLVMAVFLADRQGLISLKKISWPKVSKSAQTTPESSTLVPRHSSRVKGVMTVNGKNVALIDGQIREVGDTVDGFQIIEISKKEIILKDAAGVEKQLSVPK